MNSDKKYTHRNCKDFLPFEGAKSIICKLNLKNYKEWARYSKSKKRPQNIPSEPARVYKDSGWISYGDWLGTGTISCAKKEFISYKEAQKHISKLKIKNFTEWQTYCKLGKKPSNIPSTPNRVYKNKGWISYGKWLGTENIAVYKRKILSYEDAQKFVSNLNFKLLSEWRHYCKSGKKPSNIPSTPGQTYKNEGWISWSKWLGAKKLTNSEKNKIFFSYQDAQKFVSKLKISSSIQWHIYSKSGNKPDYIPAMPNQTYKNKGWISWGEWLGTKNLTPREKSKLFLPYEEAKAFLSNTKIKSGSQWRVYSKSGKRPYNIPHQPDRVYKNKGWISWGEWFGTGEISPSKKIYLSYEEAQKYVSKLGIKTQIEWTEYCKSGTKPQNIPSAANRIYKNKGWISLKYFLGYNKQIISFKELKKIVQENKIKTLREYKEFYRKMYLANEKEVFFTL